MSDPEHRPREHDHLVEPMYEALGKDREKGRAPADGSGRRGCAGQLGLLLALAVSAGVGWVTWGAVFSAGR